MATNTRLAAALEELGHSEREITVTLSNELVHLLSEQMYRSPLKAVEELVVNAYDADAKQCRLFVPLQPAEGDSVVVFDDGTGMDQDGLENLWHIGRSNKRAEEVAKRAKRKQIGKFGIGKLATYAIANLVTYISRSEQGIHGVTVDFTRFAADPTGGQPITLNIRSVTLDQIFDDERLARAIAAVDVDRAQLDRDQSWTVVVLEDLKPKMGRIRKRDLNWVLSTAMPLGIDFALRLNGNDIESRKAKFDQVAHFGVHELPKTRLEAIEEKTGGNWRVDGSTLYADTFPSGITGEVFVTKQSLYAGKSEDLARSHGFFVKVRGRLVEEEDPLFGIEPLSYETFNRFRAELHADDLDAVVTAPREGFEDADEVSDFRGLLKELFYEARSRFEAEQKKAAQKDARAKEHERNFVDPAHVERPLADVLASDVGDGEGSDADSTWFYLKLDDDVDVPELISKLYEPERTQYNYSDIDAGRSGRLVQFEPASSTFYVNVDHPVVQAHASPSAKPLLEDVVTAEALLEVYLRAQRVPAGVIGEILERRDSLLRSLASDRLYSVTAIASQLRESADDQYDLEVNLVIAMRALGFVAKHLSGAGNADGIARYVEYPGGERRITLEAKSSAETPSLAAIDFAGLEEHMTDESAQGCLLVAPSYPGGTRADDAAAAKRAEAGKISCWTIEQLARVVEGAEARHISAQEVLSIVQGAFSPDQVTAAVNKLLDDPTWMRRDLYGAIIDALRRLEGRLPDRPRTLGQIESEVTSREEFRDVPGQEIKLAVTALAGASQGMLQFIGGDKLVLRGDYDELERRAAQLTGRTGEPRRASTFREPSNEAGDSDPA